MKSVMQEDCSVCYLCGGKPNAWDGRLEEHHVFMGNPLRRKSEQYGLKVYLHGGKCHREGPNSVHKNIEVRRKLEKEAQRRFEQLHNGDRDLFIREFNYSRL